MSTLDIEIKAISVQLYNTSSLQTSIKLFTNLLDGEDKTNLPLLEELPLDTLTRRVPRSRRIYKIKRQNSTKEERNKMKA
jgi:hypothetical protein